MVEYIRGIVNKVNVNYNLNIKIDNNFDKVIDINKNILKITIILLNLRFIKNDNINNTLQKSFVVEFINILHNNIDNNIILYESGKYLKINKLEISYYINKNDIYIDLNFNINNINYNNYFNILTNELNTLIYTKCNIYSREQLYIIHKNKIDINLFKYLTGDKDIYEKNKCVIMEHPYIKAFIQKLSDDYDTINTSYNKTNICANLDSNYIYIDERQNQTICRIDINTLNLYKGVFGKIVVGCLYDDPHHGLNLFKVKPNIISIFKVYD